MVRASLGLTPDLLPKGDALVRADAFALHLEPGEASDAGRRSPLRIQLFNLGDVGLARSFKLSHCLGPDLVGHASQPRVRYDQARLMS